MAVKVLINASNLVKGGAIQVAASFISQSLKDPAGISWHYAVSEQVATELKSLGFSAAGMSVISESPAHSSASRKKLLVLERQLDPDVVFSVFGPVYLRFRAPHLMGVAVCWVTHSTWLAYSALPGWFRRLRAFARGIYSGYWLRFADRWVVEAENARRGMHRRLGIPLRRVAIVPNSCAEVFRDAEVPPAEVPDENSVVRLVYVSAYYAHKNIEIIPEVAADLRRLAPERRFEFVVTLPESEPALATIRTKAAKLGVENSVVSVGRISLPQVIDLYRSAHICFMPSLLETFSANYPEAMSLGRPIIASDLDFAHAVCRDAAVYFDPSSSIAAANSIIDLINDRQRWRDCIEKGYQVLNSLPTSRQKHEMYVDAIRDTATCR